MYCQGEILTGDQGDAGDLPGTGLLFEPRVAKAGVENEAGQSLENIVSMSRSGS